MSRLIRLLIPCALLVACSDSTDVASSPTTVEITTTAAPTSQAPTTEASVATTQATTTTAAPIVDRAVSFVTSGQVPSPVEFDDDRIGSIVIASQASGDLEGPLTSSVAVAEGVSIALTWFEGTVADCGTGGMMLRIGTLPDSSLGWEIVPGLGVGDLASVTGEGTEVPPNFTGTVRCGGAVDSSTFATTLIEPPAPGGVPYALMDPVGPPAVPKTVAPNPAQTMAPTILVSHVAYPNGVLRLHQMEMPATSQSALRNSAFLIWIGEGPCGDNGVARLVIDNLILPDFRGAWDVPASANGGSHGGGPISGTAGEGAVVCV